MQELRADPAHGLSSAEAQAHLRAAGPNEVAPRVVVSAWSVLWRQFQSLMVLILLVAAGVSLFLGDIEDAIAIVSILLLTVFLGFRQEYRAERGMAALESLSAPVAMVLRDGQPGSIPARDLVPGDVVLLEAGGIVPADLRLIEAHNLLVNESALTGESQAVEKDSDFLGDPETPLGDRLNLAFAGTAIAAGRANGLVVSTGKATEMGRISSLLGDQFLQATPLQLELDRVGRTLVMIALAGVAVVFAEGWYRGNNLTALIVTSISLAVAAVPEGLPAVITILLARGSQRMLARHALVRRLAAVETLGQVTVICTDKTGTLTENRQRITQVYVDGAVRELPLAVREIPLKDSAEPVRMLLTAAVLCTDVTRIAASGPTGEEAAVQRSRTDTPVDQPDQWLGDPMEVAIAQAAWASGIDKEDLERQLPRQAELPFDSVRKRMTTVHAVSAQAAHSHAESNFLRMLGLPADSSGPGLSEARPSGNGITQFSITKGAGDSLLPLLTAIWRDGGHSVGHAEPLPPFGTASVARDAIVAAHNELAGKGMRVLAVAMRLFRGEIPNSDQLEQHLVFLGFLGLLDPPRAEARAAVDTCRNAGIRVVMITGDHALTARNIAAQVGISQGDSAIPGSELRHIDAAKLDRILTTAVVARVAPEDKLNLVRALQDAGHVVAMTGDGVNDAPALKRADVGVAMGRIGTDAARDASDVVLLDDNFATVVAAVEEGRIIRSNIRKFIRYMLTCNSGELWTVMLAPLIGMPLPLTALQILWINLVTDGLPALALAMEPAEPGLMGPVSGATTPQAASRDSRRALVAASTWGSILAGGLLLGGITLASGYFAWRDGRTEWQTELFAVLTFSQLGLAIGSRSEFESVLKLGPWTNMPMFWAILGTTLLQLAVIYTPLGQRIFDTHPLSLAALGQTILLSAIPFLALELEKLVRRLRRTD
jgi:Ca2+-transporting ATPase